MTPTKSPEPPSSPGRLKYTWGASVGRMQDFREIPKPGTVGTISNGLGGSYGVHRSSQVPTLVASCYLLV